MAGPSQRFAVGFAIAEQVPLEGFKNGLGDDLRRAEIAIDAPKGEGSNIQSSFLNGGL